jgi:hypothetical protein
MLSLAAREADIVSILPTMLPGGGQFRMEESAAEVIATKIALLQRLAGARLAELELNVLIQQVRVTDDAGGVSEELSQLWPPLTPQQVRETPFLLIGTVDEIVEILQTRRAHLGISYVVIFERDMEVFAPVVARLIGG